MARLDSLRAGVEEARAEIAQVEALSLEDDSVTFKLGGEDYSLFFSGSYPGHCQVFGGEDELELSGTVLEVLLGVVRALPGGKAVGDGGMEVDDGAGAVDDHDDDIDDEDDEDYAELLMEDGGLSPSRDVQDTVVSRLMSEAEALRLASGRTCMDVQPFGDSCRVTLMVDPTVGGAITPLTAGAWDIDLEQPLCVRSLVKVTDFGKHAPSLQLYSGEFGQECKLGPEKQLLNICDAFRRVWEERTAERLTTQGQLCLGADGGCGCGLPAEGPPSRQRRRLNVCASATEIEKAVQELREQKDAWVEEAVAATEGSFFPKLWRYLHLRLPSLHQYCAICDEPHAHPPMIQRTVCSRELCWWRYAEFGKLISDADACNSNEEVTDLLVCMAIYAARSERRAKIFDPFPALFLDGDGTPALSSATPDNMLVLQQVMGQVDAARNGGNGLLWLSQIELQRSMGELVLPMVRWIRTSIRCLLLPLSVEAQLPDFRTSYQYLLVSAAPEREAEFQRLKAKRGSCFAFHGSPPENWHSIMRNGLKNASHTELMLCGAAHGSGIYLSPDAMVSAAYSKLATERDLKVAARMRGIAGYNPQAKPFSYFAGQPPGLGASQGAGQGAGPPPPDLQIGARKLAANDMKMLAVCEVINDESIHHHNEIWVCPKEECVVTRFLLVYTGKEMPVVHLGDEAVKQRLVECTKRFDALRRAPGSL